MKRSAFLIILCIFSLFACSSQDSREWFETKEEAVDHGIRTSESGSPLKQLSMEEYQGETIVFYDYAGSLGVASISKSTKGYSWYRSNPYFGFESDGEMSYSTAGFVLETESGVKIPILYGKAIDPSIEKMKVFGDGPSRDLEISKHARFYYMIHEADYDQLEITPVRFGE
ncbi:hypothetical protein FGG79_14015 [Bacillus sp. BHET2]|uniref:hypothetical protein n=1 Tax=Bacillus sp. BHET2 TaxID=2583818 RepID=UPI00110D2C64|nr:hypothetical protein [Bacillus sp. BHET2]TMU85011.1 hypothetical protein FGG79_14015 [Bacillus sp. BHET2]